MLFSMIRLMMLRSSTIRSQVSGGISLAGMTKTSGTPRTLAVVKLYTRENTCWEEGVVAGGRVSETPADAGAVPDGAAAGAMDDAGPGGAGLTEAEPL
jgi:hypothetical protein